MARCALGPLLRRGLGAAALALLLPAGAARALEEVVVELPLMESSMRVRLAEFNSPEALLRGDSQLAELDRATDGRVGRALVALFNHRLPLSITKAASASVGSPLLEQALLIVSSFGTIEGHSDDITGQTLEQTLRRAVAADPDAPDFGTIAVYSCEASCAAVAKNALESGNNCSGFQFLLTFISFSISFSNLAFIISRCEIRSDNT
ncbi:MAG: hypothetical protein EB126_02750, partial [Synechococcaceae bacterium WBB_10_009]|nr:hypothetical protein [Synechococcaceae bacterium WBB_10_009]